jgi:DNA primase
MVMVDSNVFKCFGCGSEGGVVDFLSKIESRNRQEVAVRLAKELGLTISAN